MFATVMNVPTVSYPCFVPASQAKVNLEQQNSAQNVNSTGDGDQFDFDLLAEYLLDEGNSSGPTFDFGNDNSQVNGQQQQTQSGVVSPDQTDPLVCGTQMQTTDITHNVNQVNQLVHPGAPQTAPSQPQGLAPPPPTFQFRPNPPPTQMAQAPMPMPQAPLPAPLAPAPPTPRAAPPAIALAAPSFVPVPAPIADPARMIVHQHHKRPRIDCQPQQQQQLNQPTTVAANPIVPGNVQMMQRMLAPPRGGRQKSQAQIDRRRERNRILARRTRLRKKFFFESLQKDVTDLQKENIALKEIVRSRIAANEAKPILDHCKAMEEIPSVVLEQCGDPSLLDRQDFNLYRAIKTSQQCFVITDPSLQDNPIVYASDDFLTVTGYKRADVLGRNCRFLQGPETSQSKVAMIRKGVENGNDVSVTFVNYTADGEAFWNKLFIAALRDAQNNIVNFIGVIVKVAGPEPNDPEAGKILPGENATGVAANGQENISGDGSVDADAAVMAIEGAVTAAVAAAPKGVVKNTNT